MKTPVIFCLAVLSLMMGRNPAGADDDVGVRQMMVPSQERGGNLEVTVWYPAKPGGLSVILGESAFFVGTPARRDAPIAEGRFPLILLSHGAGLAGYPQAASWLATPLAQQGFVVAAPLHPGNGGQNRSAAETMKIWLRPADLSATLTALEQDAFFKQHLKQGKIGALGLSLGGNTALAIAGARIDPTRLASYCDTDALNPSLCGWVRQSGVDLHAMNLRAAGRDNEDKRVRFVMAIDPAPVDVFDGKSFSGISIPVDLVNLGAPGKIPLTIEASKVARAIPGARYAVIADASHYSMFGECRTGAAGIAETGKIGDPICLDNGDRPRHEIHVQLIDMAGAAFSRALQTSP